MSYAFKFDKRFIVKVRWSRQGERTYPRPADVTERIFGSRQTRRRQVGTRLDGTPIWKTGTFPVTMDAFDVLKLLQRELRRSGVDRITISCVG